MPTIKLNSKPHQRQLALLIKEAHFNLIQRVNINQLVRAIELLQCARSARAKSNDLSHDVSLYDVSDGATSQTDRQAGRQDSAVTIALAD